jgi:TRAM domain-containing protein
MVNFGGAPRLVGGFADVTITAAMAHSLRGELRAAA